MELLKGTSQEPLRSFSEASQPLRSFSGASQELLRSLSGGSQEPFKSFSGASELLRSFSGASQERSAGVLAIFEPTVGGGPLRAQKSAISHEIERQQHDSYEALSFPFSFPLPN